jgi:preprotein translocase subunit SecG
MITFLYVLYVIVCLFLILVVLLQAGRGGMGSAFGGSSQTVFGGSGAGNFLTRLTVVSAALFMMLSAALTYVSSSGEKSLENASERVRLREEARSAASKDKKGGAATKPAAPAPQSSSESPGSAPSAPVETAPANPTPDKDVPAEK